MATQQRDKLTANQAYIMLKKARDSQCFRRPSFHRIGGKNSWQHNRALRTVDKLLIEMAAAADATVVSGNVFLNSGARAVDEVAGADGTMIVGNVARGVVTSPAYAVTGGSSILSADNVDY